ncbi:hypothetical protein [Botrimarina sp.]|uniref:O-antigen ligase family protein n=1 Tax=Botrimarina sp. TaxID=2795802 RepID=UPI0032EE93F8
MSGMIQYYLQTLPPWVLPVGVPAFVLLIVAAAVLIPFRQLQYVVLMLMPVSLLANQFVEIKALQAAAKVLFPVAYIALLGLLLMQPARRKIPPLSWGFVLLGLMGAVFVSRCSDATLQIYLALNYSLMAVTAIVLVSRLGSAADLRKVCLALYIGFVISTFTLAAAILFDERVMFHLGNYRFSPWGSNPNLLTAHPMLAMLGSFYLVTTRCQFHWKALALCVAGTALAELLLTGSRSVLLIAAPTLPCFAVRFIKRPVIVGLGVATAVALVGYLAAKTEHGLQLGRMGSLETSRWEIADAYLTEIEKRPLLGALEDPGIHSIMVPTIDTHSHNTWLLLLHRGGILYAGFYTLMACFSLWAGVRVLFARRRMGADPLLVTLLVALLFANYAHGVVNFTNVWATNMWAFLQVTLSVLMLTWKREINEMAHGVDRMTKSATLYNVAHAGEQAYPELAS